MQNASSTVYSWNASRMFWGAPAVRLFIVLLCLLGFGQAHAFSEVGKPLASMYSDPQPFLKAIANEQRQAPLRMAVTGISVPHHLLAVDLIARGFRAAAANHYERIVIVSPDHFNRSRKPMATTSRDIDTVLGISHNDHPATNALLQATDLFDDSELFTKEHGIAALLPFVRYFFPDAKIVPIVISFKATREDCDRALLFLKELAGPQTLVVQSTDYSHYLPVDIAKQRDQETLNIIAANDADAVFSLLQPDHMDSKGSQYVQMRLQGDIYHSEATVIANRNSAEYSGLGTNTTSYIVTVYTNRRPIGDELRYGDQQPFYFGGDTFIGRYLTEPLAQAGVASDVVGKIKTFTGGAPMIVNLEGVVMDEPPQNITDDLHVMDASLALPILQSMNVKVAGIANNHSFDLGPLGYQDSRSVLHRSGITPLGHNEIVDVGPFRLLGLNFVGKFDYHGYPAVKGDDLDEVCNMPAIPPLLAFVHWGQEYTDAAEPAQYDAAHALQTCGVVAIIGAHPHRATSRIEDVQGGEYQLTYSLGNLLFDQTSDRSSGALLELRVFKQRTYATRLVPIPNLFEFATDRLRRKQDHPLN